MKLYIAAALVLLLAAAGCSVEVATVEQSAVAADADGTAASLLRTVTVDKCEWSADHSPHPGWNIEGTLVVAANEVVDEVSFMGRVTIDDVTHTAGYTGRIVKPTPGLNAFKAFVQMEGSDGTEDASCGIEDLLVRP